MSQENKNKTVDIPSVRATSDIVVVLDESGSMEKMGNEPVQAMNSFLREQKRMVTNDQGRDHVQLSLYLFSTSVRKVIDNQSFTELKEFTDYNPSGMTALFDSIGKAINEKLATPRNRNVTLLIVTDGEENSSTEYKKKDVVALTKRVKNEYGWNIQFLGANIDAFKEGDGLGIDAQNCTNFSQKRGGFMKAMSAMSANTSAYRNSVYSQAHDLNFGNSN